MYRCLLCDKILKSEKYYERHNLKCIENIKNELKNIKNELHELKIKYNKTLKESKIDYQLASTITDESTNIDDKTIDDKTIDDKTIDDKTTDRTGDRTTERTDEVLNEDILKPINYINNYLQPSVKHIDPKEFASKYIKNPRLIPEIYVDLFKVIYFNNINNHSIYYTNLRSSTIKLFENGTFVVKTKESIRKNLIQQIEIFVDKLCNIVSNKELDNALNKIYEEKEKSPLLRKQEFSKMLIIAYENKELVKNTITSFHLVSRKQYDENNKI